MSFDFSPLKTELAGAVEWLRKEYAGVSTGRANPALLDGVVVEIYGAFQPIKNIASIATEDPRTLRITPWDKGTVKEIEKAITTSSLPFSVSVDASGLRAHLPQMTTENKTAIVKIIKQKMEDARITVRQIRQKTEKEIEAAKLPEDDARRTKDTMQKLVDETNQNLESIFSKKEEELMAV